MLRTVRSVREVPVEVAHGVPAGSESWGLAVERRATRSGLRRGVARERTRTELEAGVPAAVPPTGNHGGTMQVNIGVDPHKASHTAGRDQRRRGRARLQTGSGDPGPGRPAAGVGGAVVVKAGEDCAQRPTPSGRPVSGDGERCLEHGASLHAVRAGKHHRTLLVSDFWHR